MGGKFRDNDGEKDQIVDAENDFERGKRCQARPNLAVGDPLHGYLPASITSDEYRLGGAATLCVGRKSAIPFFL